MTFYDVFWHKSDLKPSEINAYQLKAKEEGTKILKQLSDESETLSYLCPKCNKSSPVKDFTEDLSEACCPKCKNSFTPGTLGLNISY
jgi:uncharacterized CHY-type Zn-finger protein